MTAKNKVWAAGVVAAFVLTGGAWAQQGEKPAKQEDPLKGPKVDDGGVPGERRRFTDSQGGPRERMQRELPTRAYVRAIESLKGESVPAADRLTAEQETKIKSIAQDFEKSQREYREKNREEVRGLLPKLTEEERRRAAALLGQWGGRGEGQRRGEGRGPEGAKPMGEQDGMMSEPAPSAADSDAAKARLREIADGAPKAADAHAKMFAVLSGSQKELVQKELVKIREQTQNRPAGGQQGRPAAGGGPVTSIDDPRIPEQMRERLKNMSPEDREAALKRISERIANAEGDQRRRGGQGGEGQQGGEGRGKDKQPGKDQKPGKPE